MPEYDIKPIPTEYKGRRYRSRLEARWAAFFAMLEWPFEYEPYDLGEWSPDFILIGDTVNVFVEVKPLQEYFEPKKYYHSFQKMKIDGFILLLTSTGPFKHVEYDGEKTLGIGHYLYGDDIVDLEIARVIGGVSFEIDLVRPPGRETIFMNSDIYIESEYWGEEIGDLNCFSHENNNMCPEDCIEMWAKAANEVQYMKPKEARGRR